MTPAKQLLVALAVGQGTGPELANVFERVILHLAQLYSVDLEIRRSPRVYHSYFSLLAEGGGFDKTHRLTADDAEHYEQFCRNEADVGTKVVFRTAINAQSLYLVRQQLHAVKVEELHAGAATVLLVRDQAQGFYTGSNTYDPEAGSVIRTFELNKDLMAKIVSYSIDRARQMWGHDGIDRVTMVYKFHLFDGVLSSWVKELSAYHGLKIEIVQPDTANRNLVTHGVKGHHLMIAGNEWGDIMHVMLLDRFGYGPQENRCAENVCLHPDLHGLVEYQTVHGSADDIAGRGVVNPGATLRAAATILERHGACTGAEKAMERTLQILQQQGIVTPDLGGHSSTDAVVDAVLQTSTKVATESRLSNGNSSVGGVPTTLEFVSMGKKTALLVLDFQNDFCTKEGIGAEYRGDLSRMEGPMKNVPLVVEFARSYGIEVIFVQFVGDEEHQKANWRDRDLQLQKKPKCIHGSWGAAFHGIKPYAHQGEVTFTKYAHFDAFLCDGFEEYLKRRGLEHLIFVGVYSDVCLDSTARTAFQKGYYSTVVSDCTTSLHLRDEDCLKFMKRVYGARILTRSELMSQ
jgi:nicotinamidase-related amidase/isocitrate/isopropylmalate dehydrogenase